MEATTFALVAFLVFCTAFLFAPLGLGGGMFFVPIFHYLAGWEINSALLLVSLCLVGSVSFGGSYEHRKNQQYSPEFLKEHLWFPIVGSILGVAVVFLIEDALNEVFKSLALLIVGWAIYRMANRISSKETHQAKQGNGETNLVFLRSGLTFGGMISSVMAIGAGAIHVPLIRENTDMEMRKSVGTSLNIMLFVIPVAVVTHATSMYLLSPDQWNFMIEERVWFFVSVCDYMLDFRIDHWFKSSHQIFQSKSTQLCLPCSLDSYLASLFSRPFCVISSINLDNRPFLGSIWTPD